MHFTRDERVGQEKADQEKQVDSCTLDFQRIIYSDDLVLELHNVCLIKV